MNYHEKYLKYKAKYLALQEMMNTNQMGGAKRKSNKNSKKNSKKRTKIHPKFKRMIGSCIAELKDIYAKHKDIENSIDSLSEILKDVSPCHGINHAKQVMSHAWCALESNKDEYNLNDEDTLAVLLAALLHDVDDKKFFPNNTNYENLREVLKKIGKSNDFIEDVVFMVSIVSASKNGDRIPRCVRDKPWMLIPRYADRVEAIGIVGVERCYTYTMNVSKLPLSLDSTPRPTTEEDIWKAATLERYNSYDGKSKSMVDHYYDKLLRLTYFPIRNKYLDEESTKRRKPLIDFLLDFGNGKINSYDDVDKFIKDNSAPRSISDE